MRLLHAEQGSALLEFALILPIVLLICIGMIDLSVAVQQGIVVSEAAEAGTRYGTLPSKSTDLSGMQNAAMAAAAGLTGFTATATNWCSCVPAGSPVSCATTCPSSGSPVEYVEVQTSAAIPALAKYPGLAASFALKGFSAMRVR